MAIKKERQPLEKLSLKKQYFLLTLPFLLLFFIPHADSYIPPTKAFEKLFIGTNHIEAKTWNGNLNVTCSGISCSLINGTNPELHLSSLGNVKVSIKNHSGSINATNLLTAPSSGLYRVSVYQNIVTSDVSGSLSSTIAWTDEDSLTRGLSPANNISFVTSSNFSQGTIFIDVQSGTNITYQSTVSGTAGSPTYDLYITLEKVA